MHLLVFVVGFCNLVLVSSESEFAKELRKNHYDKDARPYINQPVNVTVQVYFHTLGPIDESKFTFDVGFYLRQWWIDPRLKSNGSRFIYGTSLANIIWVPDTSISDTTKLETFINSERTEIDRKTGLVYNSRRLRAIIKCNMDLADYPMDEQKCNVKFENYAFTTRIIEISWGKFEPIQTSNDISLDGYRLQKIKPTSVKTPYKIGGSTQYFKTLTATVFVKRTVMYHVYRAYIPSILLIMFTFGTFWVPDAAVPARMGMIVTSFLSNTFILQGVTEKIVRVPYTTSMQFFLLVNVIIIVLSLVEYLLVLQLRRLAEIKIKRSASRSTKEQDSKEMVSLSIIGNKSTVKNDLDLMTTENGTGAYSNLTKKKRKTMHILDRICQPLFPLCYFVFCAAYFGHYLS